MTEEILGFKIHLFEDAGLDGIGHQIWNYKVETPTGVIFEDRDYTTSTNTSLQKAIYGLLWFLTLEPSVYYQGEYTDEQLEWMKSSEAGDIWFQLDEMEWEG